MSEQYVIYSAQERRGGSDRPQYLAMDGQAVFWSPKQKQAQRLSYKQAMRIRARFVGGNLCMVHADFML